MVLQQSTRLTFRLTARLSPIGYWLSSICAICTACGALASPAIPAGRENLRLPGLEHPVEILVDRWGVAHIYAETERDLFFAQGWNAARDRLFQLEIWRRRAEGTMAEITGRRDLKRDLGSRLHRFRGDMTAEMSHYHPRGTTIIPAFAAGINAYIDQTEDDPSLLPIEFRLLGITPGKWTPEVVVSRHNALSSNASLEWTIARAVAAGGADEVKAISGFEPPDPDISLDPLLDAELLRADVLELFNAYRQPVTFLPDDVLPQYRRREAAAALPLPEPEHDLAAAIGSNNWVLSGTITADGRTHMANDPHRAQSIPSLRYFVHLIGPGWNVIGAGEPALPGISIGHNGRGAWGLTIFSTDNEDLYVYETHPDDPLRYRFLTGWETMRVVRETFTIKGEEPVTLELKFTRHGPVLYEDPERRRAVALRAALLDAGSAPYLASLRMGQARSWEEFRDACSYNYLPGENMVWADIEGNIGWQAAGLTPVRPNWSGLVPVPGDGRYEWQGFLPIRLLPHVYNPPSGFLGTANNNLVPDDYPYRTLTAHTWSPPFRFERLVEALSQGENFTVRDSERLQLDELSIPARRLVPLLAPLQLQEPALAHARQMLQDWDFVLDRNSAAAALYVLWERQLTRALLDAVIAPELRDYAEERTQLQTMIAWLENPGEQFGADPEAARDRILRQSLSAAIQDGAQRFGPDPSAWRYGDPRFKHIRLTHPLSPALDDALSARLDLPALPRGGNVTTLNNTSSADNQASGASARIIVPTGDWDGAVATNSPGQSGDPSSSHYSDLYEPWAAGEFFPLLYPREKIEEAAGLRIVLQP